MLHNTYDILKNFCSYLHFKNDRKIIVKVLLLPILISYSQNNLSTFKIGEGCLIIKVRGTFKVSPSKLRHPHLKNDHKNII